MNKKAVISACFVGAGSILAQVILIRELLVVFSGNELSIGIMLASWLIGGAFGAMALSRIFKNAFKGFFLLAIAVMPLAVFASRASRIIFNIPLVELVSPLQALMISSAMLFPVSALFSLSFVFSCGMAERERGSENIAGNIYILEALGAALAGILFTFVLARYFTAFQLVFWIVAINTAWISFVFQKNRVFYIVAFCAAAIILATGSYNTIDKISQRLEWKGQKILEYTRSRYGNITVTESAGVVSVYENGATVFTTQDEMFDEELAHLIMLEHPSPRNVLLIGGGGGSFLRQVLMHGVSGIVYLELDPVLVEISKIYSLPEDRAALTDKRVKIINEDGIFYLKKSRERFDAIIVNLPDPTTLQINRFYTKEFYNTAKSRLKKGGVFATHVSSDENIMSYEMARYNASILKTLKSVFPYTSFIPGERLILFASSYNVFAGLSPAVLAERFQDRHLSTRFFTEYHIQDKLYPDAVSYVKKSIDEAYTSAGINTDFRPIAFYYDITLWGIKFYPKARNVFLKVMNFVNMRNAAFLALLFLFLSFVLSSKVKKHAGLAVFLAIAAIGFAGIIAHLSFILGFQALYGYVYVEIGILIALFMFGLAAGAAVAQSRHKDLKNPPVKVLRFVTAGFASYMLILPLCLAAIQASSGKMIKPLFYFLTLFNGFLMGAQFSLGLRVLTHGNDKPSRALSILWGADLIGATLGTLLASLFLIPLLGIFQSILTGFLFVLASAILLFSRYRL